MFFFVVRIDWTQVDAIDPRRYLYYPVIRENGVVLKKRSTNRTARGEAELGALEEGRYAVCSW